jgi:hypothetical protein
MPFEKAAKETLRYLFAEYLKGPAVLYPIDKIIRSHKVDPVEFSDYLMLSNWIRDRWINANNTVSCKITIKGIEQIDPVYVRSKLREVIGGLGEAGGTKELIEILQFKLEEYSITMDIIKQLEDMGLIRIIHPKDQIIVELTADGRKYYEKGSRTFFTLMAY